MQREPVSVGLRKSRREIPRAKMGEKGGQSLGEEKPGAKEKKHPGFKELPR